MSDLTEFLLARIAEDEAAAREAIGHLVNIDVDHADVAVLHHIGRWTSSRVLAECEAKRRIVALDICAACEVEDQPCDHMEDTLRALAQPFADHPDFDPAWRLS